MDAFFDGTPVDKWKEIILNASPTLVGLELERLLERMAIAEMVLENQGIELDELSRDFLNEKKAQVEERTMSLAIESMGKILGNYE